MLIGLVGLVWLLLLGSCQGCMQVLGVTHKLETHKSCFTACAACRCSE